MTMIQTLIHDGCFAIQLLNSNVSIDNCLQRCLKTNDLQELVLEVLLKIA